ncbi:MAG TPA: AAC(3) family N-acetyltransferase [Pyrinomonadaceae bacterium]
MVTNNFSKRITEGVFRRYKRAKRKLVRLNEAKILEALKSCGAFKSDLLFVHSSLSACGSIDGGPQTVVNALRSWIGDRPALAMPTHTWSYPDKTGVAPVYDYQSTPSVVGTITNFYWRQPGIVRSLHPSHSLACSGPDAERFLAGHENFETPCGEGTPYSQIAHGNSSVLMFGATMESYTLFHTAEDEAEVGYLYAPEQVTLRTKEKDGSVRSILMWRQDMSIARCFAARTDWAVDQDLVIRRKLGLSELLFIPDARALHAKMVQKLREDPLFLVDEKGRPEAQRRLRPA